MNYFLEILVSSFDPPCYFFSVSFVLVLNYSSIVVWRPREVCHIFISLCWYSTQTTYLPRIFTLWGKGGSVLMVVTVVVSVMSLHEDYTPRRNGEWPTDCQLGEETIHVPLMHMSSDKNEHGILFWGRRRYRKAKDGKLTFRRRNFLLNFSAPVFKMWIIQEPKKVALWNKRHFEEEKTQSVQHV
jgi:hypothetical protein